MVRYKKSFSWNPNVCVCALFHPQTFLWKFLAEYQSYTASFCPFFPLTADHSLCSRCLTVPAMAIRISITKYSLRIQKRRMEISLSECCVTAGKSKHMLVRTDIVTHGGFLASIFLCWLAWNLMFSIIFFYQLIVNSSTEFVKYFATVISSIFAL